MKSDKKQAIDAAIVAMLEQQAAAVGAPVQRSLREELELQHAREIRRAKQRDANFQEAYERATWMCAFCQAVHVPNVIILSQDRRVAVPIESCNCEQAQIERENQARVQQQEELARHLAYLDESPLWQQFSTEWPDKQSAREQLRVAKEKVYQWYANRSTAGLMLTGGYGCGKSHIIRAVIHAYGTQGVSVAFYTEPDLVAILTDRGESSLPVRTKCRTSAVLVIDDIGSREFNRSSEWVKHQLEGFYFQILEYRANEGKASLFSTNYRFSELEQVVGGRAYDRIHQIIGNRGNVVGLWDVPSYRRRNF